VSSRGIEGHIPHFRSAFGDCVFLAALADQAPNLPSDSLAYSDHNLALHVGGFEKPCRIGDLAQWVGFAHDAVIKTRRLVPQATS